jgi:large subunit ribosomal protein L24
MAQALYKIRLKKGDKVMVRSGKYKGQVGKIIATHPRDNKVTVEGINIIKRHLKKTQTNPAGGVKEITKPIDVSKVGILDPTGKKPTRLKYGMTDGKKTRLYVSSGKEVVSNG